MPVPALRAVRCAVVLALIALPACSGPADAPSTGSGTATRTPGAPTGGSPSDVASAVGAVLAARDAALAAGDEKAFTATVAHVDGEAGRAQLAAFRAARALRATVSHDVVPPVDDAEAVDVVQRYRVAGVDRADRTATVRYSVVPRGDGWLVASESATAGSAAPPWLAMPGLTTLRTTHAVVAGSAEPAALDSAARTVDRALPALAEHWSGTPERTLVLVPSTEDEAGSLLGSSGGGLAATTDGPVGPDGLATGDRVVLDPQARRRLTDTGRDVVLTHELVHVAVRASAPGEAPTWLDEGYADHVGYARAGLPERRLAAALVAAVGSDGVPGDLPAPSAFDPAAGGVEVGYLAAWQAAETVAELAGEDGLRRLVRACRSPDGPRDAERVCDAAMPGILGTDRAGLIRRWQLRLQALSG
ncbi:hypothetical protein JQN72_07290 [Phycicoccus sp. CSK15P-2]|uniref:hypothetical protein n=1 Tax=Phycicoccus sp. CSK15P-2 TaxID=2807627 RepID=UPI00194FB024|nr:hypothetical protein [Phycicoccus sp. CSK15P-2]MBM6404044.1 hypothetical protein [Phycicoccus sp. CSK15P-2]